MNDASSEQLGPLFTAPSSYLDLRRRLRAALGFSSLLIGIDGVDGSGKSALAAWLSWQLQTPAVHLDLYLIRDSHPMEWETEDLARILREWKNELQRAIVVEGVSL